MKKVFLLVIIFGIQHLYSQVMKIDTIQYVGDPESTYDLVILAEGYTESEIPKFREDAKNVKKTFLANTTYTQLLPKINIFSINTVSKESGISLRTNFPLPTDPIQTKDIKNTIFNIYFLNSFRAYFLDDSIVYKAKNIASEFIPFSDVVLILTNDENHSSGRASFKGVAVATRFKSTDSTWTNYLVNHELAHSIGGLADEYSEFKEISFNKDITNDTSKIRWKDMLHLPDVNIDSIYSGVYIPNINCMMAFGNGSYTCPVCAKRINEVMTAPKKIANPHRIVLDKYDKDKKTITYKWDPVPGATEYEITLKAAWRQGLINKTTSAHTVTFDLTDADVTAIPSWRIPIQIRAYDATFSSQYEMYQSSIYAHTTLSVPDVYEIKKITDTSYKLFIKSKENAVKTNWLRLYNEDGVHTDILTYSDTIALNNLKKDKKYFFQIAAALPEESSDFFASPFSPIMDLNDISTFTADEKPENFFEIAPNPVYGNELQVSLPNEISSEELEIDIFDIQGKMTKKFKPEGQPMIHLDIQELEPGTYYLHLKSKKYTGSQLFIKSH